MNELEKTIPETGNVETPNAEQAPLSSATPEATETNSPAAEEATPSTSDINSSDQEGKNNADTPNYFEMSKEELADTLAAIVDAKQAERHKEVAVIKQAFYQLRSAELEAEAAKFSEEAESGEVFESATDPQEIRFKDLLAAFREMRAAHLAAEDERRLANLARRNEIIDKLKEIAADIDNINLHIPEVRQLQEDFKTIGDIPAGSVSDSWKNYQTVVEQIFDCLKMNKELRDLDFKKNLEIKKDLIEQAKLLTEEEDVIDAFKKLQALHDLWRETGPVAKEYREDIWNEFKALSTIINKRHQDFFEARKQEEQANEAAKTALCEEIEKIQIDELKTFAAFEEATTAIKEMQARWKELGFASRKANNTLFARFRKAADDFFARKAEFYTKTKAELAQNLEKKIALCEKAEALKDSTDFKKTADAIMALQAEWKTIGSVPRKHSDSVWQRFMAACNTFFDARKKDMANRRQEENENLAAKHLVIEALKAIPSDAQRSQVIETLKEQQARWNAIGHVPFKVKDKLYEEYRATLAAVRENFDLRESRARMNRFEEQISSLNGDDRKLSRERDRLSRALEQKRNELKTFENNLGFFNIKSKEGSSMLREMQHRTQRIKDDIKELENKIKLLDQSKNAPEQEA
ncbi:MAG: DUF349 domain-containing protein [Prevotella sp.]|nr:DUF349 domain-containing protein [Prevotella sp.]MCM1074313.1 DUF349 domain-containing protein [Ruminococcus sp.]